VAEAAAVADEMGIERLTLAAVAARCGVSLPGLYKHVTGLDAVKRSIGLLAVDELTTQLAAATAGLTGRDALHALCTTYRTYALQYPGRYAESVQAPAPGDDEGAQAGARAIALIGAALQGYGLEGSALIHAIRMLRIVCHGSASLEAAGGFALAESMDDTIDHLVDVLDAAFRNLPST
jgi:AcrR family transcriptional regulator